jgi:3-oxoacyl-[acyl-carrier protein] reductase
MLKDRYALITGASRGIGAAIARNFALNGAKLILISRDYDALKNLQDELSHTEVHIFLADISKHSDVKELFLKIKKLTPHLDIVINNAGILEGALLSMTKESSIQQTFETNLFGQFYILQYTTRLMRKSSSASIVNITSAMGVQGARGHSMYSASKAAVIGFSRSLSKELAPHIRVNAIAPGVIQTDLTANLDDKKREEFISDTLLKRVGLADEVAQSALFLASDMSSFITGEVLSVDGGLCLR